MTGRLLRALSAAILLVALSAAAVSAGGWATIAADTSNGQPTEGEPTTLGFTVLQHGVTPAGWEQPTLVATETATGERIEVTATPQGAEGHFVATVTIPRAGFWTWQVELRDLLVEATPLPLPVATADGTIPTMDAASVLATIERSRADLAAELRTEAASEIEALRVQVSSLGSQLAAARAESAELAATVEALGGGPSVAGGGAPLVAVLAIGGLAGAFAGFAIAWLGRPSPTGAGSARAGVVVSRH